MSDCQCALCTIERRLLGRIDELERLLADQRRLPPMEVMAARVHDVWMNKQREGGVTSRLSASTGEEQMVPYAQLSETVKEYDRMLVREVYAALDDAIPPGPGA